MKYLRDGGSWVKWYKYKNQLLMIVLAVGFFVGIIYENIVSKRFGVSLDIFQTYFLNQYAQIEIVAEEYLWYVAKARLFPLFGIVLAGCLKWKKVIACGVTAWTGFLAGILIVAAMMQLGIKGILFCVAGMLPHMICYVLAYSVLLLYYYRYPERRWSPAKTIFVVLNMFLGVVLETYLNPLLIKIVIRFL